MKQIKVQQLTHEKFRRYGTYVNLLSDEECAEYSVNKQGFFADVITLNFGPHTLPTVSVCSVKKPADGKMIVGFVECHAYTCEGLMPIDHDCIIYTGVVPRGDLSLAIDTVEAFLVPKGTYLKYEPLILHGSQYPVGADTAHLICQLPQRTFHNDMKALRLDDNQKFEIVM